MIAMLYSGAVVVEAFAVWLFLHGSSLWLVGASAVLGVAILLFVDWALEQRSSGPGRA